MNAYTQYHGRHVLPVAGGWTDQPTCWAQFVGVVDGERAWWEDQERKQQSNREAIEKAKQVQAQAWGGVRRV